MNFKKGDRVMLTKTVASQWRYEPTYDDPHCHGIAYSPKTEFITAGRVGTISSLTYTMLAANKYVFSGYMVKFVGYETVGVDKDWVRALAPLEQMADQI